MKKKILIISIITIIILIAGIYLYITQLDGNSKININYVLNKNKYVYLENNFHIKKFIKNPTSYTVELRGIRINARLSHEEKIELASHFSGIQMKATNDKYYFGVHTFNFYNEEERFSFSIARHRIMISNKYSLQGLDTYETDGNYSLPFENLYNKYWMLQND